MEWIPDGDDIPPTRADLFSTASTTNRRRAHVSRSLVSDYIAATAERNASASASGNDGGGESADPSEQLLPPQLRRFVLPPTRGRWTTSGGQDVRSVFEGTGAGEVVTVSVEPRPTIQEAIGSASGNDAGRSEMAAASETCSPSTTITGGDNELSLDQLLGAPTSLVSPPQASERSLGMSLPNGGINPSGGVNLRARDLNAQRSSLRNPWGAGIDFARRAGYGSTSTHLEGTNTAEASSLGNREALTLGNRARRTILQDTAPRPRPRLAPAPVPPQPQSIAPPQPQPTITPSGSHFAWVSYTPGSARTVVGAPATGEASETPAADSSSTRVPPNPAPEPETTPRTRSDRNERMATIALRRRRNNGERAGMIYTFDPTDIAPPGGADDHIWNTLADPDSEEDDGWGVYVNGARLDLNAEPLDAVYLDAWGAPPDSGAALSRGGFNRRRQSFRANRDDWDVSQISVDISLRPASSLPPTNVESVNRAPQPIIVESGVGATRRRSVEDSSPSVKRQKTSSHRPSYLAHTVLPPSTPIPSSFNTPDSYSRLKVSTADDGRTTITFVDDAGDTLKDDKYDPCAIRSATPIPPGIGVYYFEAEVLCLGYKAHITLGFMLPHIGLRRLVGWDAGTWGWHGDDGRIFEQAGDGRPFSEPWEANEIIGMGIDYTTSRAFLTRNGKLVGTAFRDLPQNLHVAVGMQSADESVAINFAGPFKYDIDAHVAAIAQRVRAPLYPQQVTFSQNVDSRIPRIAGSGGGKQEYPPSGFNDSSGRAQAALVLDYLAANGHSDVLESLKASMVARGYITKSRSVAGYPSAAAALSSLVSTLSSPGTPHIPFTLMDEMGISLPLPLVARLKIYDFAAEAEHKMEVDGVDDILAQARNLGVEARGWEATEIALLQHASAILAGGAAREGAIAILEAQRKEDVLAIERAARDALGMPQHSLLSRALAQTNLVHQVLRDRGDGEVAFVSVQDAIDGKLGSAP